MSEDKLYSFIMRGELTKVTLESSGIISKHSTSAALAQKYIDSLSLDLLDDKCKQQKQWQRYILQLQHLKTWFGSLL